MHVTGPQCGPAGRRRHRSRTAHDALLRRRPGPERCGSCHTPHAQAPGASCFTATRRPAQGNRGRIGGLCDGCGEMLEGLLPCRGKVGCVQATLPNRWIGGVLCYKILLHCLYHTLSYLYPLFFLRMVPGFVDVFR